MKSFFSQEFFTNNRHKLRALVPEGALVIVTAGGLLQRGGDSTYGFSQDASFWYLTGLEEPDLILVMNDTSEYLIVPTRSASRQAFDGAITSAPLTKRSGIKAIYDEKEGWEKLGAQLKKVKQAATIFAPPAYMERYGLYTNPARAVLLTRLKDIKPRLRFYDLSAHLINMRAIKQPAELAAIQAAIDITVETIKEITKSQKLKSYEYEYQAEAELSRGFRMRGADGHAFEPIVAGGQRACTLHNVKNNAKLNRHELLLIDSGAEVEHYAADITRTFSLSKPSARQCEVYEAVKTVQAYAFDLLKAGVSLREYEQQIEHYMGHELRRLGLLKRINSKNVRHYYPHSTSHAMGLNVHDVLDYEQPLLPGTVITVEPGIYIAEEGIGIRIEDDVLITNKGIKILTDKLPRRL